MASDHSPHLLHVHPLFGLILSLAAASSAEMSADDLVRLSRRALQLLEPVERCSFGFRGARRVGMAMGRLLSQAAQVALLIGLTRVQRSQDQFDGGAIGGLVLMTGSSGPDWSRLALGFVSWIFGFLRRGSGDVGRRRSIEDLVFFLDVGSFLENGFGCGGIDAVFTGGFAGTFLDFPGFVGGSPGCNAGCRP